MKPTLGVLTLFLALACGQIAAGQTSPDKAPGGILGYLDPKTGAFRPLAKSQQEIPEAAVTPTTGKFVFHITVSIQSTFAAGTPIVCSANASTYDTTNFLYFDEEASVTAQQTGATATCSIVIPYSWPLSTPAADSVTLSYTVSAGVFESSKTLTRMLNHSLPGIKVPAHGATTTETIATVI